MVDYAKLKETILLFWDTKENFYNEGTQQKLIPKVFQSAILIDSLEKMREVLASDYALDQKFLFFVHLDHANDNKGLSSFIASLIQHEYPNLSVYYVSSAPKKTIYAKEQNGNMTVYSYDNIHSDIGTMKRQTKIEILNKYSHLEDLSNKSGWVAQNFKYAILVALFEDEFEELQAIFDFPQEETIRVNKKVFRVGYLKSNKSKKVVAGVLNNTGPIESGIVASMMLELFKPDYILMSGVCGGAPKYAFGDIIIAKKIFAFQKGKISDHPSLLDLLDEDESKPYTLYDKSHQPIDIRNLYDENSNRVVVSTDNFELEHDAMINLSTEVEDELVAKIASIKRDINEQIRSDLRFQSPALPNVNIAIEPMASGTMVINKKGYFDEVIKSAIDRKTAAVEMESYGLARACQYANEGKSIPIVFKSVMDHTYKKADAPGGINVKRFAAYTSALFMKNLFEKEII